MPGSVHQQGPGTSRAHTHQTISPAVVRSKQTIFVQQEAVKGDRSDTKMQGVRYALHP